MKIQTNLLYKTSCYTSKYVTKPFSQNSFDRISFSSKILSEDELKPYFQTAELLIEEANEIKQKAQNQVPFANQMLEIAKNYKDEVQIYLDLIKQNPIQNPLEIDDKKISYSFNLDGDNLYLDINLKDSKNDTIKRIRTLNGEVKSIFYQDSSGLESLFQYGKDNISYMFDVKKQNDDTLKAKFCYTYIDDELASIKENPTFASWIQRHSAYYYFKDDTLTFASTKGFSTQPDNTTRDEKRYCYDKKGNLLNFIFDYSRSAKGRLSYRDGMHFKDGQFIAWTHKTLQPILNEPLEMYDCVYLKNGKWIQDKSKHCIYSDFELVEIL